MIIGVDIRVLGTGKMSGIEEYTEQLLAHMLAPSIGGDVQWKLFYSGRTLLAHRSWMDVPNVSVYATGMSNRWLWMRIRLTGRPHLDELVGGADVFFFPHFLLGALSPNCKRVTTWHDLSYERMPELLSWHRRRWHDLQMQPRMQAHCSDRIVAVSRSTADDLTQLYGIDWQRISVVHSGIDPAMRRASPDAVRQWRERRGISGPFVLAIGTREPRKNLGALATACRNLQVQLVIAGGRGWGREDLGGAIILDDVDRAERPIILSAASVLAYPSLFEGFGFPPLEAMACGTPVVAGATSSVFEMVGDAGILVDPYRVDQLIGALDAIMHDHGLRSRLIARGFERSAHCSWQQAAEKTLRAISSVVY